MTYRVTYVTADELAPHAEPLRDLERSITYPIADGADHFYIDHGASYARFFVELGTYAGFMLAYDGDQLVGCLAGVRRRARVGDALVPSFYLADYKVRAAHRGRGVGPALIWTAMRRLADPQVYNARILYAVAMRGARGDVMRSARGRNAVFRVARPIGTLALYFVAPDQLARLGLANAPAPPRGPGFDLSPDVGTSTRGPGIVNTAGRKDLRLVSTGAPWPLEHLPLGPAAWPLGLGAYLRACGEALGAEPAAAAGARCCFALDERLDDHVRWLRGQGVEPGARCTAYALRLPPGRGRFEYVHVATSDI